MYVRAVVSGGNGSVVKALVQRVAEARVEASGRTTGAIGPGLLVFLGVEKGDTAEDVEYICNKIAGLRVFPDDGGKMNLSLRDTGHAVLVVSQFTLAADCRKGNRPSFDSAEEPRKASALYETAVQRLRGMDLPVSTGEFAAAMLVHLVNDGPVTLLIESRKQRT